jgi:hypothetical protein
MYSPVKYGFSRETSERPKTVKRAEENNAAFTEKRFGRV